MGLHCRCQGGGMPSDAAGAPGARGGRSAWWMRDRYAPANTAATSISRNDVSQSRCAREPGRRPAGMISAAPGVVRACAGPTWMSLLARLAVARLAGFEPATGCLEGSCSVQLSYRRPEFIVHDRGHALD